LQSLIRSSLQLQILPFLNPFPSISPSNQLLQYLITTSLWGRKILPLVPFIIHVLLIIHSMIMRNLKVRACMSVSCAAKGSTPATHLVATKHLTAHNLKTRNKDTIMLSIRMMKMMRNINIVVMFATRFFHPSRLCVDTWDVTKEMGRLFTRQLHHLLTYQNIWYQYRIRPIKVARGILVSISLMKMLLEHSCKFLMIIIMVTVGDLNSLLYFIRVFVQFKENDLFFSR